MSLQDIVGAEKRKAQALFDDYNRDGSDLLIKWPDGERTNLGTVDRWEVLRVGLVVDAAGKLTKARFWVHFTLPGFYEDLHQGGHVVYAVDRRPQPGNALELVDDHDRRYWVAPLSDEDSVAAWTEWARVRDKDRVKSARRRLLAQARETAEQWQS